MSFIVAFDPYDGDFERDDSEYNTPDSSVSVTSGFCSPLQISTTPRSFTSYQHDAILSHKLTSLCPSHSDVDHWQSPTSPLVFPRSPSSASPFAPGAHRRSHPNLQHLSLAPLTPKYPITPSDYDAYVDPDTQTLHTSVSLSHIASIPSPGGVLSNSQTRGRAHTHIQQGLRRKTKSNVFIRAPGDPHLTGAIRTLQDAPASEYLGANVKTRASRSTANLRLDTSPGHKKADSSWLIQTGVALAEGSRESKGQSWLVKRASSTSLQSPVDPDDNPTYDYAYGRMSKSPFPSGRDTPDRGRQRSRSRRRSRRDLAMTFSTAITAKVPLAAPSIDSVIDATDDPTLSRSITTGSRNNEFGAGVTRPDWVDSQTQAEIAAELDGELAAELDAAELYSDDDEEPYWRDEHADTEADEKDVQDALREKGFRFGRWVDRIVDVFLKMDDDADDGEDDRDLEENDAPSVLSSKAKQDEMVLQDVNLTSSPVSEKNISSRHGKEPKAEDDKATDVDMDAASNASTETNSIDPAPENPTSVWEDVAWFGRLVLRTARS